MNDELPPSRSPGGSTRFFHAVDWAAFGLTTLLAWVVYALAMPPEVGLGDEGSFDVSAAYLGVPDNPGFPVWNVYAWLFTQLPCSNYAWRVALSITVADALVCGVIALMVSRVGLLLSESLPGSKVFAAREMGWFRIVCGGAAGLGFGFDGCFWTWSGRYYPQSLNVLLLALTLCLLTRWLFVPQQRRCLYAAVFIYGLALCDGQSLVTAIPGLVIMAALADRKLGREILFLLFAWSVVCLLWFVRDTVLSLHLIVGIIGLLAGAGWIVLMIRTRGFFTEWKAVLVCVMLFCLGLSAYLLLPVFSTMNPPMNWGYPRAREGFYAVLSRAQYEQVHPTDNLPQLMMQLWLYGKIAMKEFGLGYLLAAVIPFCTLRKIPSPARRWLLGILALWLSAAMLQLVGLNMGSDKASVDLIKPFYSETHLLLALMSGCGLMLAAIFFVRPRSAAFTPLQASNAPKVPVNHPTLAR